MNETQRTFLNALFKPTDIVGFKNNVYTPIGEPTSATEFICLNPLLDASAKSFALENIAEFRNFLIEIDDRSLKAQEGLIEKRLNVPWTTKTFSGSKSLHYIISLEESLKDLEEYRFYSELIYAIVKVMDPRCSNANRLTRLAGSTRQTGALQELKGTRKRISLEELKKWCYEEHSVATAAYLAQIELRKEKFKNQQRGLLSFTTQELLQHGRMYGDESRHDALVRAAVNMVHAGLTLEEIEDNLYKAAELLGVDGRGDVKGILNWIERTF